MKVVILAGGYGTRISEESQNKPKPLVEVGGFPILWHIMKTYSHYGFNEFIICAGYKQYAIKEYFANYFLHHSDITFDFTKSNQLTIHSEHAEPWKVTVVDTGLDTMTGGRVKRVKDFIGDETFMLTYGDGVADVNIPELVKFHKQKGQLATLTAVSIGQRFGCLDVDENNNISSFREKNDMDGSLVNAGFMVLEPQVLDYIEGDSTSFEKAPVENLAKDGQLNAYLHKGFWKPVDTLREKLELDDLWNSGKAPWKVW